MAILTVRDTRRQLQDRGEIEAFLKPYGIACEVWDVARLQAEPERAGESAQDRVLRLFAAEVAQLQRRGGYAAADVIALRPDTPNLDAMLAKFRPEHHHTEDEVRFVVSGRGIFTIHGADGVVFDIEVRPGDLLVVPSGTWHWFDLCPDRQIQCIRLFTSKEGWAPVYRQASS